MKNLVKLFIAFLIVFLVSCTTIRHMNSGSIVLNDGRTHSFTNGTVYIHDGDIIVRSDGNIFSKSLKDVNEIRLRKE